MNDDIDLNKVDTEFCKVLDASHGRGNNLTVYNLIKNYGCTADDVVGVAKRTNNEGHCANLVNTNEHWSNRELNKRKYSSKKRSNWACIDGHYAVGLSNYKWYFKNVPDEYLDGIIVDSPDVMRNLIGNSKTGLSESDDASILYTFNQICKRIFSDNYLGDLLNSRLRSNKVLLDAYLKQKFTDFHFYDTGFTITLLDEIDVSYFRTLCSRVYKSDAGGSLKQVFVENDEAKPVLDLIAQIYVLALTMANESYDNMSYDERGKQLQYVDGVRLDGKGMKCHLKLYTDHLFYIGRRGTGLVSYNSNKPSAVRIELFGQARTLEMLLSLGLGIRVKDSAWGRDLRVSDKKLNNRIKTAYKTFLKLKTVNERKNFRKLFKEQLSIIVNDYMMNGYEVVELKCVEEQDKAFEDSLSKPKKAKKMTKTPNGVAFDADFLSKLPTVKM